MDDPTLDTFLRRSTPPAAPADPALEAIATLPDRDREVVRLVYWDGFTLWRSAGFVSVDDGSRSRSKLLGAQIRSRLPTPLSARRAPIIPTTQAVALAAFLVSQPSRRWSGFSRARETTRRAARSTSAGRTITTQ